MINWLKDFMFKSWDKMKENIILKNAKEWQALDPNDENYNKKKAENLSLAWMMNRVFYRLAKYLQRAENAKIISIYFIYSISFTFFYTITIFAFEYVACAYLFPESFNGFYPSLLNSFYFSFLTIITMNFGDIVPVSGIAKVLVSLEALSSLVIGVILFFVFTTIILDKYKKDIDDLINKLFEEEVIVKQLMTREFGKGLRDLLIELSFISSEGVKSKNPKFILPDDDEIIDV